MKNIILILISLLLSTHIQAEQTFILEKNNQKQRKTLIFMKKDHFGNIYYQDINGRNAIPNGESFNINLAPGVTYSPSAKKITIINETTLANNTENKEINYDQRTDPQIGLGYFLGTIVGNK